MINIGLGNTNATQLTSIQSNLPMWSPLLDNHLYWKVTFSCPVIENFIWIEPLSRCHLSYKVIFSLSQRWPLNTGLTVILFQTMIRRHIYKSNNCLFLNPVCIYYVWCTVFLPPANKVWGGMYIGITPSVLPCTL